MQSFEFKLLSGVTCAVREMTIADEERFTANKKGLTPLHKINQLLASCIVRVGDAVFFEMSEAARIDFVRQMLSKDRELTLIQIQQFSTEFSDFSINSKLTISLQNIIENAIPYAQNIVRTKGGVFERIEAAALPSYSDIVRFFYVDLPNFRVRFSLLSGIDEEILAAQKEDDLNINSRVVARCPCRYVDKNKQGEPITGQWISLNISRDISRRELAQLRAAMSAAEATLETTVLDDEFKGHTIFTPDFFILGGVI